MFQADLAEQLLTQVSRGNATRGPRAGYKVWDDNVPIWKPQTPVIGRGMGASRDRIGGYEPESQAAEVVPSASTRPSAEVSAWEVLNGIVSIGYAVLIILMIIVLIMWIARIGRPTMSERLQDELGVLLRKLVAK